MQGKFQGIGAQIDLYQSRPRIVTPLEDSVAWEAGVLASDIILEIDGETTLGMSLSDAVDKLKGEKGTKVTIKVLHEDGDKEKITITRGKIDVNTVRGFWRGSGDNFIVDDRGIAYIRVSQFGQKTADELRDTLKLVKGDRLEGVILDLRFNPGGLLQSAVLVSDMFLPKGSEQGKDIVTVRGRTVAPTTYRSSAQTILPNVPVVVLANSGSASAAEIVSGALKDNHRAHVVGTRTFGKGSVQQLHVLESGQGALKVTAAYYYLPSGRNIHRREGDERWGVDPSPGSYVPMSLAAVQEMVELRHEKHVLHRGPDEQDRPTVDPAYLREERGDPQLAAALEAMLRKLETGEWPTVGKPDGARHSRAQRLDRLRRRRDILQQQLDEVQSELENVRSGSASQPDAVGTSPQPEEQ